jgi:hypothetical protein
MEKTMEPISKWDDKEVNYDAGVVWVAQLDGRYLCEVVRIGENKDREGHLCVFDREKGMECVYDEIVGLAYGAQFGPDVDDVALWEDKIMAFVDK